MASQGKKYVIGVTTAVAIVAANMIGTGVFTSLGFQVVDLKDGFTILALWGLGGIVALFGAFAYGELSAAMPRSGGEYHLLSQIYHPALGFLSGWLSLIVGFSAPIAAATMAMGKYAGQVIIDLTVLSAGQQDLLMPVIAIAAVSLVSLVHLFNVKVVSSFQIFFTGLKIFLILVLIVFGFMLAPGQDISFAPTPGALKAIFSAPFAVSLIFVMYAYSGWNASTYIAGEIRNPGRNLPLSLFLGTLIVMLLYVPLNGVFLYSTPLSEMELKVEIGYISANYIFGNTGGIIMGSLISIGLISAISSMVWAGPRVTQVMGEDTRILRFLARKNKNGVPAYALALQFAIVILLILTSTFEAVVYYIGFTLSLSTFLTVLGVFVMRYKRPDMPRPYKTWGYPITPAFFLLVTGWMLVYVLIDRPVESLAGLATIGVGYVLYEINRNIEKNRASEPPTPRK